MEPIKYVSCLNETYQAEGFPPYRWSEFDSSPWQPFEKPLNQTRLALISSGGIFKEDQAPFDPWAVNDLSFREIDVDVDFKKLNLHHNYFDHRDALQDFNVVYPVDRLKELAEAGFIGSLAPTVISLGMGRLYKRTALQEETVPKILKILQSQNVEAVLLVPA
jgi:D-proline reductase (dithiol) PrdB